MARESQVRPEQSYTLWRVNSLGVDIGGTSVKVARIDSKGNIAEHSSTPTTADDPDQIVADVVALSRELADSETVAAGVAVAAFLSPDRDTIQMSPNISWRDRPLRKELEDGLGLPVVVDNDANAAALGEFWLGSGRGSHSLVMLTLGTGVGGGVVIDGNVLVGAHGLGAELGHIVVNPEGEQCGCGLFGCLETIASGTAIVQAVRRARGNPALTFHEVELILRGDPPLARKIIDDVARAIASSLVSVTAVVDPDTVVLGGGVVERIGEPLVSAVQSHYEALVSSRFVEVSPRIVAAHLGNQAGMLGAAFLALRRAGVPAATQLG